MIPQPISEYLEQRRVPYASRHHRRAVSAQQLAASIHVSGYRVAKVVVVRAGSSHWLAVLPAAEQVDESQLARALNVDPHSLRLEGEPEFEKQFTQCELGAEPPLGGLFGLPVIVDSSLAQNEKIVFRGGTHEDTVEMRYVDFLALEKPTVAAFAYRQ